MSPKSRRITPVDNWWKRQFSKILHRINFQSILMAIVAGGFGIVTTKQSNLAQTQEQSAIKQDSVAVVDSTWKKRSEGWRKRSDSIATITILKLDSVLVLLRNK